MRIDASLCVVVDMLTDADVGKKEVALGSVAVDTDLAIGTEEEDGALEDSFRPVVGGLDEIASI